MFSKVPTTDRERDSDVLTRAFSITSGDSKGMTLSTHPCIASILTLRHMLSETPPMMTYTNWQSASFRNSRDPDPASDDSPEVL